VWYSPAREIFQIQVVVPSILNSLGLFLIKIYQSYVVFYPHIYAKLLLNSMVCALLE